MPRRPRGQDVQYFAHMTEALRHGRRRIKAEFVPELVAWLRVHSFQYEKILNHFKTLANEGSDPLIMKNAQYAKHALAVIQVLINTLYEGVNKYDWTKAIDEVSAQLSIEIGKELPNVHANLEANPLHFAEK